MSKKPHSSLVSALRAVALVLACLCLTAAAQATDAARVAPPFEHYQPILDRMPFGSLPANFSAEAVDPATLKNEAQVKAEQQALAKKVNMSAVNVTPEGSTAIGFTDLSVNPPVSYYLRVGDEAGGWTVLSADYDTETAAIEKDGVTITLKLGKGLVDAPPAAAAAGAAAPAAPAAATPRPALPPGLINLRKLGTSGGAAPAAKEAAAESTRSYAERLRERATQKTQAQMAAEAKMREQFEKLARETAAREIQRREDEVALAAQEQAQQQEMQQQPGAQPQQEEQPQQEQ